MDRTNSPQAADEDASTPLGMRRLAKATGLPVSCLWVVSAALVCAVVFATAYFTQLQMDAAHRRKLREQVLAAPSASNPRAALAIVEGISAQVEAGRYQWWELNLSQRQVDEIISGLQTRIDRAPKIEARRHAPEERGAAVDEAQPDATDALQSGIRTYSLSHGRSPTTSEAARAAQQFVKQFLTKSESSLFLPPMVVDREGDQGVVVAGYVRILGVGRERKFICVMRHTGRQIEFLDAWFID